MNRVSKIIAVTTAAAIGGLSIAGSASARDWRHHHDRGGNDAAIAAGIAGLAAGVIAGAIISDPGPRPVYEVGPPRYYGRERYEYRAPRYYEGPRYDYRARYVEPAYGPEIQPWTGKWYSYCRARYRSFSEQTGTYTGYDGQQHFCAP